jgi:A/G-specific adenine glycosylase
MLTSLIKWSKDQHSHLLWRQERSLYVTLVSEIMLQQTTVSTVSNHIEKFLKKYPTLNSLSKSTEEEVCIAWKGLGYYRRARNLLNAAIDIEENFNGEIPLDLEQLKSIKGIGEYTANAILGIGANKRALAVDANLERVIARVYGIKTIKGPKLQKDIYRKFYSKEILPQIKNGNARKINEALMDLGRVICQSRKAECILCPLSKDCKSYKDNIVNEIPNIVKKEQEKFDLDLVRVLITKKNKVLGYAKSEKEWLRGQIELPTFIIKSADKKLSQYPKSKRKFLKKDLKDLVLYKTSITKYKINNYILKLPFNELDTLVEDLDHFEYFDIDPEKTNFSTASIKALGKSL